MGDQRPLGEAERAIGAVMAQWWRSRRYQALAVSALALIAAGALVSSAQAADTPGATSSPSATITVSATGKALGTPDTLNLTMGVSTTAASASAALERNNAAMAKLQATLTSAGVSNASMQTAALSLSPNANANGRIIDYEADDTLTVTLGELTKAGAVIDAASTAAGNATRIESISFSISHSAGLLNAARRRAMAKATAAATTLAVAAGEHLGRVLKIDEQSTQLPSPPLAYAAGAAHSVPLQPGTMPVSVQLQVVFALQQ